MYDNDLGHFNLDINLDIIVADAQREVGLSVKNTKNMKAMQATSGNTKEVCYMNFYILSLYQHFYLQ